MDEITNTALSERNIALDINTKLAGELTHMSTGVAHLNFTPTEDMRLDNRLVSSGFIFNSASFCALSAVNKRNSLVIGADIKFLAPIELGYTIKFKANALQDDTKKIEVQVEGFLLDIKVFYGMFYIAVFDKGIFKLKKGES
ncbi:thioesterase [Helicobacter sp. 11S02629-2]|uniref:thioesterase n=1 Tax=Helicobacter sp. 11S02629-2 TaxID=1476195 RepID=UPI000BA78583|nr:thioesterase [Helicobacter sp. 11S02629-2]PAF43108.1 thioesterase [Helicobacter sp. 11S02629-2]